VVDGEIYLEAVEVTSAPVTQAAEHLALSSGADPIDAYCDAAGDAMDKELIRAGYRAAVAIIGASRVHWMLSGGLSLPEWYVDSILNARSAGS
jgi:hypothetical protein